jgi:6-pyruvoyltetrahydropterin/6-carboxytetrahydropterin synthase
MMETFKQFNFEAAHQTPPYSGLHGHSFTVSLYLVGEPDPVYGWTHNLYDVDAAIETIRKDIDHKYLNDVKGLEVPTLENLTSWLVERLDAVLDGVDRVQVRRGLEGSAEGCTMRPRKKHNQAQHNQARAA